MRNTDKSQHFSTDLKFSHLRFCEVRRSDTAGAARASTRARGLVIFAGIYARVGLSCWVGLVALSMVSRAMWPISQHTSLPGSPLAVLFVLFGKGQGKPQRSPAALPPLPLVEVGVVNDDLKREIGPKLPRKCT